MSVDKRAERFAFGAWKKGKAKRKAMKAYRAYKTRKKGEAALAAGDVQKAQRLRKRYDRKTARDKKKAARKGSTPDYSGSPAQKKYCKK